MKTTLTDGQMAAFLKILRQKKVTPDRFQRVLMNGILTDVFDEEADVMNRQDWRDALQLDFRPRPLTVDYTLDLDEMLRRAKCYTPGTLFHEQETELWEPSQGKKEFMACLGKMRNPAWTKDRVSHLHMSYYRHADLWELLAFVARYGGPFPTVALGATFPFRAQTDLTVYPLIEGSGYRESDAPAHQLIAPFGKEGERHFPMNWYYLYVRE